MNATPPIRHPSAAARVGLAALSVLSLLGGLRLAVFTEGPLRILLALLGFAGYVALFARALDGPELRRFWA